MTKKVWVLMGNDFPEGVYANETAAHAEAARRKSGQEGPTRPPIYWRVYCFDLIEN